MPRGQTNTVLCYLRTLADGGKPDRALLERFASLRDEAAFSALLRRHGPMVLRLCRRVLGREQDAEDVFQATFLVLSQRAASVQRRECVGSWLYGVAYHLALKEKAKGVRRREHEGHKAKEAAGDPLREITVREAEEILDQELAGLPDVYRAPLVLCYLEGLTRDEAAQRLGWPLGTLKGRLERARARLHARLAGRGLSPQAALLGCLFAEVPGPAGGSGALFSLTTKAAAAVAAGGAASAVVPARVAALAEGALKSMFVSKVKGAAVVVLLLGALGLGAGGLAGRGVLRAPQAAARAANPAAPAWDEPGGGASPRRGGGVPAASPEATKGGPSQVEFRGQVLGPDGKPLAGAKLYLLGGRRGGPTAGKETGMKLVGASDRDGRFRVAVTPPAPDGRFHLVAHAASFGVDWVGLGEGEPPGEVTLRLPKDVPITGRVVDAEGRPVAGASVSASSVFVLEGGKPDVLFLAGRLRDNPPKKRLDVRLDAVTGAVTTNKEGRFTLKGAGAERVVRLAVAGAGVARSSPYVVTRPGFDPRPYNEEIRKDYRALTRFFGLYPPSLTFVAEPGRAVEGVVKDAKSGEPVPGCRLRAQTGSPDEVVVASDAKGRYRIDGLPKDPRDYAVSVSPPKGTVYLRRTARAADGPGYSPLRLDVELVKGVVVTGRVLDRHSGKGVRAGVRVAPLADNEFVKGRPGLENDRPVEATDQDGRFRLVAAPGKVLVLAGVQGRERLDGHQLSPYRQAVPDPGHKDLFVFDADADSWVVPTAAGPQFLGNWNAARVVDVKEAGETTADLAVDRGATARLAVEDADGKPLAGAWVAGLTEQWPITYRLPGATGTVYALSPERPRTLVLFHPEKKLGGTLTVRGDEKEPVVARLGPAGRVTGRLLGADGRPLAGAEVSVSPQGLAARELHRFAGPTGEAAVTDKDGRFSVSGVVPGVSVVLRVRKGGSLLISKPRVGQRLLKLKPGESLDLGERRMEQAP